MSIGMGLHHLQHRHLQQFGLMLVAVETLNEFIDYINQETDYIFARKKNQLADIVGTNVTGDRLQNTTQYN